MKQDQALQVLVQAAIVGQKNGAYTFDEATIIKQAIDTFKPVEQAAAEQVEQIEE